jgi:lipoate---protein ligase
VTSEFRVIDTGLRNGRFNIAFDKAMIEAHQAGDIPNTIRFLQFPPTALVGRHQVLSREINLDACREKKIGVARRITGGGAIYFDEKQLGWELVFHRQSLGISDLGGLAQKICEAASLGLRKLGINAQFRPRNDIEVEGRKLCGTGGFFDGDTLFYQGTLLIDLNPDDMFTAIKVPRAKLEKRNLETGSQRVVTLRELLGDNTPDVAALQECLLKGFQEGLDINCMPGDVTKVETQLAREFYSKQIGTDAFVAEIDEAEDNAHIFEGSHTGSGGTITAQVRLNGGLRDHIQDVVFSGDFFVTPTRVLFDLEANLRGVHLAQLDNAVISFFNDASAEILSASPEDFCAALDSALCPNP